MDLQAILPGGLIPRLAIDLACVFALVRVIYYRTYRRADLFLTFFSFNLVIFLIAFVLNRAEMSMGAAFGLFAVFSMLRYRTEGISTTDMTYLFLGIALGLIMAVSTAGTATLAAIGALVVGATWLLESGALSARELRQEVLYDEIRLVNAHARADLVADLRRRTGLSVRRVEVLEIDLVRDAARLAVYYHARDAAAIEGSAPRVGGVEKRAVA